MAVRCEAVRYLLMLMFVVSRALHCMLIRSCLGPVPAALRLGGRVDNYLSSQYNTTHVFSHIFSSI